ncbi:MAG TPA: phytase [Woeseiaceae bacterium]|nr:phytase [Woeseiaceae bacterium]
MRIIHLSALLLLLAACGQPDRRPEPGGSSGPVTVPATAATEPVEFGALVNAAFWVDPGRPEAALILGAAGISGIEMYRPDGTRAGGFEGVDGGFVTVVPDPKGGQTPLVMVYDRRDSALKGYRLDRDALSLVPVMPEPLPLDDELTGLCHYHSPLSDSDYVYAVTDGGVILHFELFTTGTGVGGQLLRTIPSGKGSGFCDVDPVDGMLYVAEETVGIWRFGAEPESDTTREPVALVAPWGTLTEEVKGIGIYTVDTETSYLVAADVGASRLAVFDPATSQLIGAAEVPTLVEAEGVAVTAATLGGAYPSGLIAVADEDESAGGTDLKLIGWRAVASALGLGAASGEGIPAEAVPAVRPVLETEVAASYGDAADDPAIWVHPDDPAKSLVIGTDKQLGLYVFDLEGRTVQTLPDGRMNNVDLRDGFPLGGRSVTLVAASNRSTDSIAIYSIEPGAARLVEAAAGTLPTGFTDPYGLCLYRSAASGEFYVFVNEGGDGTFRQWRLFDNGEGRVSASLLREFAVGSQAEGCVADDELGHLYVNEEDSGLWKYSAEPDGGNARTRIDSTEGGRLEADVEGVSLWTADDGAGYLVVSNQGADNYFVYERAGDNAYVGHFHVVANAAEGIDGASETDGLAVTSAFLGDRFPDGLLVVQDGRNIAPEERQNFKYVSWTDVADALGL